MSENREETINEEPVEIEQEDRYLTFELAGQAYGLEILHLNEIVGVQAITELPESPEYIKGVINLRGKLIQVTDMRLRFGMEFREYDERSCIIVTTVGSESVGLIVDGVSDVLSIPDESISPPPQSNQTDACADYIIGMGRHKESVIILLDTEKLLHGQAVSV